MGMKDKSIFVKLAKMLVDSGVDVEFESDFEYWKEHREIKYTEVPYIGSGWYGGRDGFYFKKGAYKDWSESEEIKIQSVFENIQIDGYQLELNNIDGIEYDDDRIWKASFGFFVDKI